MKYKELQKLTLEQFEELKEENKKLKKELKENKQKLKAYQIGAKLDDLLIEKLKNHLNKQKF